MQTDGVSCSPDILPPIITQPVDGAVNAVLGFLVLTAPFISPITTLATTDWEVWTGPGGTGTRAYNASNVLLSITVPALTLSTGQVYYLRARYNGLQNGIVSVWSPDVRITT